MTSAASTGLALRKVDVREGSSLVWDFLDRFLIWAVCVVGVMRERLLVVSVEAEMIVCMMNYEKKAGELLLFVFKSNRFVNPTRRGRPLGGIMIGIRRTR